MDRREQEALDRHITGNYGEDQFDGVFVTEDGREYLVGDGILEEVTATCPHCGLEADGHVEEETDEGYLRLVCQTDVQTDVQINNQED